MVTKLLTLASQISVEPINLLFLLGQMSVEPVREDFFLQTICNHNFPNDSNEVCENVSSYNKTLKIDTESEAASYITIWFIFYISRFLAFLPKSNQNIIQLTK